MNRFVYFCEGSCDMEGIYALYHDYLPYLHIEDRKGYALFEYCDDVPVLFDKDKIIKDVNHPIEKLHEYLIKRNLTISVAESLTSGRLGDILTKYSGSSSYFKGGIMAYANDIKESVLNVPNELLREKGAVSEEVVKYMSEGVQKLTKTDISVSLSGIAGPSGGGEKPVGLVWIDVFYKGNHFSKKFRFLGDRDLVKEFSVNSALFLLWGVLNG